MGRFLQPDPLVGDIGNPQTLNRYAYSHNDPVNKMEEFVFRVLGTECAAIGPGRTTGWNPESLQF